jgi:hypothetical protein
MLKFFKFFSKPKKKCNSDRYVSWRITTRLAAMMGLSLSGLNRSTLVAISWATDRADGLSSSSTVGPAIDFYFLFLGFENRK